MSIENSFEPCFHQVLTPSCAHRRRRRPVAAGVDFLHKQSPRIFHLDLKAWRRRLRRRLSLVLSRRAAFVFSMSLTRRRRAEPQRGAQRGDDPQSLRVRCGAAGRAHAFLPLLIIIIFAFSFAIVSAFSPHSCFPFLPAASASPPSATSRSWPPPPAARSSTVRTPSVLIKNQTVPHAHEFFFPPPPLKSGAGGGHARRRRRRRRRHRPGGRRRVGPGLRAVRRGANTHPKWRRLRQRIRSIIVPLSRHFRRRRAAARGARGCPRASTLCRPHPVLPGSRPNVPPNRRRGA